MGGGSGYALIPFECLALPLLFEASNILRWIEFVAWWYCVPRLRIGVGVSRYLYNRSPRSRIIISGVKLTEIKKWTYHF